MRVPLLAFATALIVGLAAASAPGDLRAQQATITVDTTSDTVANDGECSLREAIANANAGATTHGDCAGGGIENEIVLPQGEFVLTAGELVITAPTLIRGVGDSPADTVLSGNDASRIFSIEADVTVTLEDLHLRQGAAPHGAAIYQELGDLSLSNLRIEENHASNEGGGIYTTATAGSLTMVDTWVRFNSATVAGGGISVYAPTASITNGFMAENSTDGVGGGIFLAITEAVVTDTTIRENTATNGAGIMVLDSIPPVDLTVDGSIISSNDATGHGGAIYFESGTLVVQDSGIGLNDGDTGGAGIWVWLPAGGTADVSILGSHFSTNVSANGGALGFHATAGTGLLRVASSSFSNNNSFGYSSMGLYGVTGTVVNTTFGSSAGINVRVSDPDADVTFTNSTFIGDYQGFVAADVLLLAIHDATVTVNNSVFVDAREDSCVEENQGSIQGSGNADDDGTCPGAIAIGDDVLGPFANANAWTFAHFPTPGSPLIDAANPAFCPDVDQRGWTRSATCDIGAIEFTYTLNVPLVAKDVD